MGLIDNIRMHLQIKGFAKMTIMDTNHILLKVIKMLREEMITIGLSEGLNSKNTLKISQMLDTYISKYQKINHTK